MSRFKTGMKYTPEEWELVYTERAANAASDLNIIANLSTELLSAEAGEAETGEQIVKVTFSVRGAERLVRDWHE